MTLAEAIEIAERNKRMVPDAREVSQALEVLYEELKRRPLQFGRAPSEPLER